QHGVASAAACARVGLPCRVYMGAVDMERQSPNVDRMLRLGAEVFPVTSGDKTLRAAIDEALREWVSDPEGTYYLLGSAVGPHPYPWLVRELQAVIGQEAREQMLRQAGGLPDAAFACVGGGSNAIGLFYPLLGDESIELIGVEAGGTAWIHDYNLWLVPGYLRALRPDLTIGFFLHTPFPGPDVFGILPWREEILRSLLCADRVGFHVARYAENFAQSAECFCRAEPSRRRSVGRHLAQLGSVLHQVSYPTALLSKDHLTHVDVAPIGINTQLIQQVLRRRQTGLEIANIRAQLGVEKIIFSVGRIDYTKGSKEVLDGFDRLLSRHPEWVGRVKLVLTSVAPAKGMSVYEDIQLEIEQRVGNINGRYSELNWVPVLLFTTPIGFEELVAWYAAADICWITPLRDGLNLVAKEYAMAQQDRAGVLILSEFAGSVIELDEAIHVNPYSRDSMDAGLDRALTMTPEEATGRMRAMGQRLRLRSLSSWTRRMTELFANRELTLDPAE
ncbi:MAG: pyridoxal-phosphate dependent enzyme, partial [Burkholderiaceae bacterium]